MHEIRQICEQENETFRQQVKRVANKVGALVKQKQLLGGNRDSILNIIPTELDEKIDKLTEVQPDISALVGELFTLRCDTNPLLEAQSALCRTTQEEIAKTEKISVENVDETAEVAHPLSRTISRQACTISGNEPRNNRSKRMTNSLTTIVIDVTTTQSKASQVTLMMNM